MSMIGIYWLEFVDLPGGTVAVVQCGGLCVEEAISLLLGKDLVPALIKILVYST